LKLAPSLTTALLFRFIYKDQYLVDEAPPNLVSANEIDLVLRFFKKFDMPILLATVAQAYIPLLPRGSCHKAFSLACIYGHLSLAREAMKLFGRVSVPQAGARFWNEEHHLFQNDQCSISILVDLSAEYTERIPYQALRNLAMVQMKVLSSGDHFYTRNDAAEEFTFW